jgi:hypothetical protein
MDVTSMVVQVRRRMLRMLIAYAGSPQGRQRLEQVRRGLDTPANRQRARQVLDRVTRRVPR